MVVCFCSTTHQEREREKNFTKENEREKKLELINKTEAAYFIFAIQSTLHHLLLLPSRLNIFINHVC